MSRKSKLPDLSPVDAYPVAPHRYLYNAPFDPAELERTTARQVRDAAPYRPGEVILVVYGDGYRRAYVHAVGCNRDYYGDLRETYEVRPETKAGYFSKLTHTTHPGLVQRAYQRAGQAPEMPEGEQ